MNDSDKETIRKQRIIEDKIRDVQEYIEHLEVKKDETEEELYGVDEDDEEWKYLNDELQDTDRKLSDAYDELASLL